jgi:20S proteasome alpha/beta subunit
MTCIVGYVEKDGAVYMAADSAASDGESVCIRKDTKLFILRDILVGFSGSYRVGQILRYANDIPRQQKYQDDHEFLCTSFVDFLIETLEDSRALQTDNGTASLGETNLLVGYKGTLYHIDADAQVGMDDLPYCSIGSGHQYATGAMYALEGYRMSPKKRLEKAIMAAADNSTGVLPPVYMAVAGKKGCELL